MVEKIEDCVKKFLVACSFRSSTDNFECAGVYGLNDDVDMKCL